MKISLINIAAYLFFTLLISSCKKGNQVIDQVPVDTYVYLNQPLYVNLNVINGWVYISGGVKGIIVYHGIDGYKAYDRSCTYDPKTACNPSIYVSSDNITCIDSCCTGTACCGSKFIISDGGPISGPATIALVQYQTQLNSDGSQLHIFN
ncbi:MAG: hypothetical protein ABI723_23535 [Bacteroidia bacterium]